MRTSSLIGFLLLAAIFTTLGSAQMPNATDPQKVMALVKVQTQQAQITDNQAKIGSKLADLAETIRAARIYLKRENDPDLPFICDRIRFCDNPRPGPIAGTDHCPGCFINSRQAGRSSGGSHRPGRFRSGCDQASRANESGKRRNF